MKYTIELTDAEYNILTGFMNMISSEIQAYYFQKTALEPIKTTNVEDTNEYQIGYKTGYDKGYYDGYDKCLHSSANDDYEKGKLDGLEEFENLFINEYDYEQFFEDTYGSKDPDYNLYDLVAKYGAKKVLDDFKKWQEEKKKAEEEFRVGDVVKFNEKCHNYDHVKSREFLVLHVFDNGLVTLLYDNGDTGAADRSLLDKTSRHIDEVEQLLDKLRGEEE